MSMLGNIIDADIAEMIAARDFEGLRVALSELPAPDVAEVLVDLPEGDEACLFRLLPRELAAEAFTHLSSADQETLVSRLSGEVLSNILNDLPPDDRTRLLGELPGEVTRRLLTVLSPEEMRVARTLLGYPENSIGRLMTPEYVAVRMDMTAAAVLEHVRANGAGKETLDELYVIDERGKLLDHLRLAQVVLARPDARVADIVDGQFVSLSAFEEQEAAVSVFRKYGRSALPVIDSGGILLGIVTVDDVLEVAKQEADEDIQKFAGQAAIEDPYFDTGVWTMIRKRGTWLVALFVGELLTSNALSAYEHAFEIVPSLVLFIPLIISSGGNSGGQSASLILRGLTTREITPGDWWRVAVREAGTGLALGLLLSVVGFARVWFMPPKGVDGAMIAQVGFSVAGGVIGCVMMGAIVGALLPMFFKRLGADPAVTSSPFIATLVDVTGIIIYFAVASVFLREAFAAGAALKAAAGSG